MDKAHFVKANGIFKQLREMGFHNPLISRRLAIRALVKTLAIKTKKGQIECLETSYPSIEGLLVVSYKYNQSYLDDAYGTLRFIRGDFITKEKGEIG